MEYINNVTLAAIGSVERLEQAVPQGREKKAPEASL